MELQRTAGAVRGADDAPSTTSTDLVLLPGLAGHSGEFAAQRQHLGAYRQIFAMAPFVDGDLTVDGRARRVAEFAREHHLDRYVVLGHSISGLVALDLATQQPPGLVGVVVLDSALLIPQPVRVLLRAPLILLRTPLARGLLRRFFDATFTAADPADFRDAVRRRLAATPIEAQRVLTHSNFTYDTTRAIGSIELPVLVIRANIPINLDQLPPHVHRTTIADAGHWPHVHAPPAVNTALDEFLATVDLATMRAVDAAHSDAPSAAADTRHQASTASLNHP